MELKVGYKQTEIGTAPIDWLEKQIGELHPYVTSGSRGWAAYYADHGAPFIRITNLIRSSIYLCLDDLRFVNIPGGCSEGARTQLQNGDVLISITADIGIVGYVSANVPKPSYINQHIALIRFDPSSVCSQFVSYFLASERPQRVFRALTDSGAKAGMNLSTVQQVHLNLPPTKAEQEDIAMSLSDTDALIASLEQFLAKKRQIKQGAMQELLAGKKRLPGFTNEWDVRTIGEFTDCAAGGTPSTAIPEYWGGDIPWMNSGELNLKTVHHVEGRITDLGLRNSSTKMIPAQSVLIGLAGQGRTRGTVAMNMIPLCTNQSIAAIFPNMTFVSKYLFFNLDARYEELRELSAGDGGRGGLNLTIIRSLRVPLPPLDEQEAIVAVLSDLDAEIDTLDARLVKVRQIKEGMMQELLTGRIRLLQPSAEVVPFPVKQSASARTNANHNPQINEAVVLAVLAHYFGSEQFPLGRFRRTKLSYLLHRHAEQKVTGFMKKAAGPYNPRTRYGGAEKIALKNGFVRIHKTAKGEGFIAADNIDQAEGYFENWYGIQVLDWLKQFRYRRNEELELLTTVDMAIEDLRREGKSVTVSAVKQIIHDSPEWKAKLDRTTFADSNITAAIESCRQLFPDEE